VSTLSKTLSSPPYNLPTVVLSIDDLYLPRAQQQALAESNPDNPLVQHRGVPSTHDIAIGNALFEALSNRESNLKIPSYDKSQFNGAGDRRPENEWDVVNVPGRPPVEVVIFEGWCVGFRALSSEELRTSWLGAKEQADAPQSQYNGRLGRLQWEHVEFVNNKLRAYDVLTNRLNALIHIDASNLQFVYDWRLEQEAAMRAAKGTGMTDEQVRAFVDGYYPSYELYTKALRDGIFGGQAGQQLRITVGKDRKPVDVRVS